MEGYRGRLKRQVREADQGSQERRGKERKKERKREK